MEFDEKMEVQLVVFCTARRAVTRPAKRAKSIEAAEKFPRTIDISIPDVLQCELERGNE